MSRVWDGLRTGEQKVLSAGAPPAPPLQAEMIPRVQVPGFFPWGGQAVWGRVGLDFYPSRFPPGTTLSLHV